MSERCRVSFERGPECGGPLAVDLVRLSFAGRRGLPFRWDLEVPSRGYAFDGPATVTHKSFVGDVVRFGPVAVDHDCHATLCTPIVESRSFIWLRSSSGDRTVTSPGCQKPVCSARVGQIRTAAVEELEHTHEPGSRPSEPLWMSVGVTRV